jgi:hypothetical protein
MAAARVLTPVANQELGHRLANGLAVSAKSALACAISVRSCRKADDLIFADHGWLRTLTDDTQNQMVEHRETSIKIAHHGHPELERRIFFQFQRRTQQPPPPTWPRRH